MQQVSPQAFGASKDIVVQLLCRNISHRTALLFDAVRLEARAELSSQCSMDVLPADDGALRRTSTPTTSRRSLSSQAPQRQVSLPALLASRCSLASGGAPAKAGGAAAPS